jgi:energy-coupling factor transport system substrate-specific component
MSAAHAHRLRPSVPSVELAAITLLGASIFLWPFVASGAPAPTVSLAISLGMVGTLAFIELATRRLDARGFALLAAIAAIDAGLRLILVIGISGFSPIFFLILVAGYVYGPSFGFLCGATSLLASALATGGVGPWLPYELIGCGWMGMVAGIAGLRRHGPPTRRDLVVLALVAVVTGYAYGALLDVWDWTTFYRGVPGFGFITGLDPLAAASRFARFYAATSFVWDSFRAGGDALAIVLLGATVLAALRRLRNRFTVTIIDDDQPLTAGQRTRTIGTPG